MNIQSYNEIFGGIIAIISSMLFIKIIDKDARLKKYILIVFFSFYLAQMFIIVGIPALQVIEWNPVGNIIPFRDKQVDGYRFQVTMNVIMFMPFGFLIPMIWRELRGALRMVFTSLSGSLLIELIQLFSYRKTDVDDLIMNTLGGLTGYLIALFLFGKEWNLGKYDYPYELFKKKKAYTELAGLITVSVITVFIVKTIIYMLMVKG